VHLVDSNVLLDVLTDNSAWFQWSAARIAEQLVEGVGINALILAEVSANFDSWEAVDAAVPRASFARLDLPFEAAFVASRVFVSYKRRGGTKTSPMPDFYIGAHALVAGLTLITRDATPYRTYFPDVELVAPDTA
jgi:predicted nucleic acid-binding protein